MAELQTRGREQAAHFDQQKKEARELPTVESALLVAEAELRRKNPGAPVEIPEDPSEIDKLLQSHQNYKKENPDAKASEHLNYTRIQEASDAARQEFWDQWIDNQPTEAGATPESQAQKIQRAWLDSNKNWIDDATNETVAAGTRRHRQEALSAVGISTDLTLRDTSLRNFQDTYGGDDGLKKFIGKIAESCRAEPDNPNADFDYLKFNQRMESLQDFFINFGEKFEDNKIQDLMKYYLRAYVILETPADSKHKQPLLDGVKQKLPQTPKASATDNPKPTDADERPKLTEEEEKRAKLDELLTNRNLDPIETEGLLTPTGNESSQSNAMAMIGDFIRRHPDVLPATTRTLSQAIRSLTSSADPAIQTLQCLSLNYTHPTNIAPSISDTTMAENRVVTALGLEFNNRQRDGYLLHTTALNELPADALDTTRFLLFEGEDNKTNVVLSEHYDHSHLRRLLETHYQPDRITFLSPEEFEKKLKEKKTPTPMPPKEATDIPPSGEITPEQRAEIKKKIEALQDPKERGEFMNSLNARVREIIAGITGQCTLELADGNTYTLDATGNLEPDKQIVARAANGKEINITRPSIWTVHRILNPDGTTAYDRDQEILTLNLLASKPDLPENPETPPVEPPEAKHEPEAITHEGAKIAGKEELTDFYTTVRRLAGNQPHYAKRIKIDSEALKSICEKINVKEESIGQLIDFIRTEELPVHRVAKIIVEELEADTTAQSLEERIKNRFPPKEKAKYEAVLTQLEVFTDLNLPPKAEEAKTDIPAPERKTINEKSLSDFYHNFNRVVAAVANNTESGGGLRALIETCNGANLDTKQILEIITLAKSGGVSSELSGALVEEYPHGANGILERILKRFPGKENELTAQFLELETVMGYDLSEKKEIEPQSNWQVFGESVIGDTHEKDSIPKQDALLTTKLDNGDAIVAAADGHSSSYRSDRGAQYAVEIATEIFKDLSEKLQKKDSFAARSLNDYLNVDLPKFIARSWRAKVENDLNENPITETELTEKSKERYRDEIRKDNYRAYGSTLLVAACLGNMHGMEIFLRIGDGDILLTTKDEATGELKLQEPLEENVIKKPEEKIGDDTRSLCDRNAEKYVQVAVRHAREDKKPMITVSTDGFEKAFTRGHSAYLENLKQWYDMPTDQLNIQLKDYLKENPAKFYGDDVTVGIIRNF